VEQIYLPKAGIYYSEEQNNSLYVHIVTYYDKETDKDMIALIGSIDQSEIGSQFTAMTFGKILYSIPMLQFIKDVGSIENGPNEE
jgi:hypothetical protein